MFLIRSLPLPRQFVYFIFILIWWTVFGGFFSVHQSFNQLSSTYVNYNDFIILFCSFFLSFFLLDHEACDNTSKLIVGILLVKALFSVNLGSFLPLELFFYDRFLHISQLRCQNWSKRFITVSDWPGLEHTHVASCHYVCQSNKPGQLIENFKGNYLAILSLVDTNFVPEVVI